MTTATIKKLSSKIRTERADALREAALQIESCWQCDSLGAARDFILGDPSVADHLGSLDPPRWIRPLISSDPQDCVSSLLSEAIRYEE